MNSRNCFLFIFALGLVAALTAGPLSRANARRRSRRRQERSAPRCRIGDQPDQCRRRTGARRDRAHRPRQRRAAGDGRQHQSFARAQRDAQARPYRVRRRDALSRRRDTADLRRVSLRHRKFGQGRLQDHNAAGDHRRPRHHARYPVAARPDHRQPAGRRRPAVCTVSFECIQLTRPGDTAIITSSGGRSTIKKTNNPPWTFAATCSAAAGLCSTTQYADASPVIRR